MTLRPSKRLSHRSRTWLLAFVAILGLVGSLIQPATAQVQESSPTANQFFDAVESGSQMASASGSTVLRTPLGTFTGAGGPAEFGRALAQSFSFIEFTTDSVETVEQLVIVRFTMTAVHTGTFENLYASCARISVPGVAIMQTGYRMVVTENTDSGALGHHIDPAYTVQMVVTQQWIGYDVDLIETQIDRHNGNVPNARRSCADWNPNVAIR